jgi:hypothetical protein
MFKGRTALVTGSTSGFGDGADASSCAVPIVHKAGDVAPKRDGTSHWWQNHGKVPAKLISVDLFPVADKMHEKMM